LDVGRRERKKQQTRQAIADAAMALFAEHGFEAVTVAQVARAADVAVQTVFNYFPAKEDLFFTEDASGFLERVTDAVRTTPAGESVLTRLRPLFLGNFEEALATGTFDSIEATARIIESSPALRARQQADLARWSTAVAAAITETVGTDATDPAPLLAANVLVGVYQAVFETARRRVLAGQRGTRLQSQLRADAARCWTLAEEGLAAYLIPRHTEPSDSGSPRLPARTHATAPGAQR
jgi:AcrR family transcriptional regulator